MAAPKSMQPNPSVVGDTSIELVWTQRMMENAGLVIYTVDSSGRFTSVSSSVERLTGYPPDELIGRHFAEFVTAEWREWVQSFYQKQFEQRTSETLYEFPILARDGQQRWVEQVVMLVQQDELPPCFQCLMHDVTHRKLVEEELRASQIRYRALLDSTFEAIVIHENGKILDVNPAYEQMFSIAREVAVGKSIFDLVHPSIHDTLKDYLAQQFLGPFESIALRADGSSFPVEVRAKMMTYQGRTVRVAAIRDVSKNYENERRYRALFERTNDAVFIIGLDRKIIAANQRAADMLGYTIDELEGSFSQDHTLNEETENINLRYQQINENDILPLYERGFRRKDGSIFPAEISLSLVRDSAGRPLHIQSIVRDISTRKKHEENLAADRNLLRTLIDNIPDHIHVKDQQGRYLLSNAAFAQHVGAESPDAMIGKTPMEYFGEVLGRSFVEIDRRLLESGQAAVNHEARDAFSHDKERWFSYVKVPLRDETGESYAVITIARDITERLKNERDLAASEQRSRAILDTIPDMMFIINRDGTFIDAHVNPWNVTLLPEDRIVGANLRDGFMPPQVVEQSFYSIERAFESHEVETFEYDIDNEETTRSFEARVVALNDSECMIIARDMTDLKRVENELSRYIADLTLLHRIESELSNRLNIDYVIRMALDSAMRLNNAEAGFIALLEEDQLKLAHSIGLYQPEQLKAKLRSPDSIVQQALRSQKAMLIKDVRQVKGYHEVLASSRAKIVIPLMSARNQAIGILNLETSKPDHFSQDTFEFLKLVTGRIAVAIDNARLYRQTQQQLSEMQRLFDQVRRLEQLKTEMIRIASHDLRNPLATLMGFLQIIRIEQEDSLSQDILDKLDTMENAARRMHKIIADILSLERIEEMAQNSTIELIDLAAVIQITFDEHRSSAKLSEQHYQLNLHTTPVMIHADTVQIKEAAANLISNAIKYTPTAGQIQVELSVNEGKAIFQVIDTGFGVPEAQQKRLFQPFFRAASKETKEIEGTGLGLTLVKNIVERSGGRMIFHSVYGQGSTFGFEMPVAAPENAD